MQYAVLVTVQFIYTVLLAILQKLAVKRVRDAFTRHDKWHLAAFLKEMGCAASSEQEPVTKAEFERVKDNGLRALHPANQQGWPCTRYKQNADKHK